MKNKKYIIILVAIVLVALVGNYMKYKDEKGKSSGSGCLPSPEVFFYDSREELVRGIYKMDLTNVDKYNHKSLLDTWHKYQELGYLYDVNVTNEEFVKESRTAFTQASSIDDAYVTYYLKNNAEIYTVQIMLIDDTIEGWTTFQEYIEKRYGYINPLTVTINDKEVLTVEHWRFDFYYAFGQIDSNYYFHISRKDNEWKHVIKSIEFERFELIPEEVITNEETQ